MKKLLLTLLVQSFCFSSAVFAQDVPGGFSDGLDAGGFADPPAQFKITNYPNPVTTNTTFKYDIPSYGKVSLKLFNSSGQLIKSIFTGYQKAGSYTIDYNAANICRGIYVSRLSVTSGTKNADLIGRINVVK